MLQYLHVQIISERKEESSESVQSSFRCIYNSAQHILKLLSPSLCMKQIKNGWTDFDGIWYLSLTEIIQPFQF
jgi:hypothetical protein